MVPVEREQEKVEDWYILNPCCKISDLIVVLTCLVMLTRLQCTPEMIVSTILTTGI